MMVKWPRHVLYLGTISGFPVLTARSMWALFAALTPTSLSLWEKVLPFVKVEERRAIAWEARLLVAIHASIFANIYFLYPPLQVFYLGMAFSHAIMSVHITCEHRGLPADNDLPVLAKTRSIRTPALWCWLLWNMPYHAEHHAWPSVPFHRLPELHEEVKEHLPHRVSLFALHLSRGDL